MPCQGMRAAWTMSCRAWPRGASIPVFGCLHVAARRVPRREGVVRVGRESLVQAERIAAVEARSAAITVRLLAQCQQPWRWSMKPAALLLLLASLAFASSAAADQLLFSFTGFDYEDP